MEKIKVNMTPCEEVKTIHASQNDNATRKWAFDLYDENGKIGSSDIKEQMIFDSRVGGTEQILPENTSNPTTSPIIADIQYPDSLRSEQTFLYRESPTTEDGQAKITRIKGNTVKFNQLVSSNTSSLALTNGHKFYTVISGTKSIVNGTGQTISVSGGVDMAMDLTLMGIDNLTTTAEVEAWLSSHIGNLPYYAYTTGKLLPFKGESLKTTGKNRLPLYLNDIKLLNTDGTWNNNVYSLNGITFTVNVNENGSVLNVEASGTATANTTFWLPDGNLEEGTEYILNGCPSGGSGSEYRVSYYTGATTYSDIGSGTTFVFTKGSAVPRADIRVYNAYAISGKLTFYPMVRFADITDNTFEPYTSSTINLPTLTYFPTGMKDCSQSSQVFDEKTENEAKTRVGSVDLSSLTWYMQNRRFQSTSLDGLIKKYDASETPNIVCNAYLTYSASTSFTVGITSFTSNNIAYLRVYDSNYTSLDSFVASLTGKQMYYELETPTEESITTASLVTEKGETPLYYDDELIADCNETISSESGIFDAKIKLMDDETVYSQKIQLHVERKPQ